MADLIFTVEFDDKGTPVLKEIRRNVGETERSTERAGRGMALAMDKADSGFKKVLATTRSLAGILGITAGAAGLVAFTRSVLNTADRLGDLADQTGLSMRTLIGLRQITAATGITVDELAQGVQFMLRQIVETADGGKEAANALKRLGWSIEEVTKLASDPDKFLEEFAKRLATIPTHAERLAVAQDLASRAGARLAPTLLQIAEHGLPKVSDETVKAYERLSQLTDQLAVFTVKVVDFFVTVAGGIGKDLGFISRSAEELRFAIEQTKLHAPGDVVTLKRLQEQLKVAEELESKVAAISKAQIKPRVSDDVAKRTESAVRGLTSSLEGQEKALIKQRIELERGSRAALEYALAEDLAALKAKLLQEKLPIPKDLDARFKTLKDRVLEAASALEAAKFQAEGLDEVARRLDQDLLEVAGASEDLQKRLDAAFADLDKRIPDLTKTLKLEVLSEPERRIEEIRRELDERINLINRWRDAAEKAGQDVSEINQRAAELSGLAAQSAMDKMKDASEDTSEFMRRAFERGFDAIADGLTDLLDNGVTNFEDFAEKIRKTINRLVADQLTLQLRDLIAGKGYGTPGVPLGGVAAQARDLVLGWFGRGTDKRVGQAFQPSEQFGGKTQMDFLDQEFGQLLSGGTAAIQATSTAATAAIQAAASTAQATAQAAIQSAATTATTGIQAATTTATTSINSTQIVAEASIKSVEAVAIAAIQSAAVGKAPGSGSLNPFSFLTPGGSEPPIPGMDLWGVSFWQRGGVIGRDRAPLGLVDPRVFAHAPRYQGGGVVGDEVPIIAHRGERILSVEETRQFEAGRGRSFVLQKGAIQINARDAGSFMKLSESEISGKFERSLMRARRRSI